MSVLQFLLLEASLPDADVVQTTLREVGIDCELLRVETRSDFVTALKTNGFDLVLSDYTLPDFEGIDVLATARSLCPETPFIFVAGSVGEELAIEAIKQGATDYVLKHRLGRLVPAVQQALQEAKERRERQHQQVEEVSVDMWGGFPKGLSEVFPNAELVFDRFHVMKPVNKELNKVRRQVGIKLKGSKFILLKNKVI